MKMPFLASLFALVAALMISIFSVAAVYITAWCIVLACNTPFGLACIWSLVFVFVFGVILFRLIEEESHEIRPFKD